MSRLDPIGKWQHDTQHPYGDDTSYERGITFLDGHGLIADWGCGPTWAKTFIRHSAYLGIDGSGNMADVIADLRTYRVPSDCIFMRHVLEHNIEWRRILANAVTSFRQRMFIAIFTPFHEMDFVMDENHGDLPDIALCHDDFRAALAGLTVSEALIHSNTKYGMEGLFYIERTP